MTFAQTPADRAFQEEVRAFVAAEFPASMRERVDAGQELGWDEVVRWHEILAAKGWIAPAWPAAHGGPGWPVHWRFIFEEELALAGCPQTLSTNIRMIGPVLILHGTDAQREKHLPGILAARDWWCQGYSEPGSGSDLASLRTTARRDGDEYVINGSKIWTSYAQHSNKMFCLVRTDSNAKPQEGISFLLIDDIHVPGLEIRPIHMFNGHHEFNQVFFDDLRVPAENLVGEENKGWTVAKSLLTYERLSGSRGPESKRLLGRLHAVAQLEPSGAKRLMDEPWFQRRLWALEVDHTALAQTILRFVEASAAGQELGPETSLLKARGNIVHQAAHELLADAVGYYGLPLEADARALGEVESFFGPLYAESITARRYFSRGVSIAGGTQEVQAVVTAKRALGL